jgi:hypothetical protein
VLHYASMHGSVAMLTWLWSTICSGSSDVGKLKQAMLHAAACYSNMPTAQWLRTQGAAWPTSLCVIAKYGANPVGMCWSVSAVQWALSCGSGWLDWKCEEYAATQYNTEQFKQQATELLEWAHANGCPCTCGHAQQQQQQQQ